MSIIGVIQVDTRSLDYNSHEISSGLGPPALGLGFGNSASTYSWGSNHTYNSGHLF